MTVKDSVTAFVNDYNEKLNQLNEKLQSCSNRIEELQYEIRFLKEKEVPEATTIRVLQGDSSLEKKLKKSLSRFEEELQELLEEQIVLINAIKQFKYQSGEKVNEFAQLLKEERRLNEDKAYSHMMHFKKLYVDEIRKQSAVFHEYKDLSLQLETIEVKAGIKKNVYSTITDNTTKMPPHISGYNGYYLALTPNEIQQLINKTFRPSDVAYLDKFKHKKDL